MAEEKNKLPKAEKPDYIELVVDEVSYTTLSNKMNDKRKPYVPVNPAQLKSFMPGNIPEIFVSEGQEVKEGEPLLILEAMKMKNVILAPYDGKVKSIFVKIGDILPKNTALLEME